MPGHRVANLFCTPGRCPAILMTATRWAPSSKPLRGSPAARSSVLMSTRDTAATMPQTRAASSSQAKTRGLRPHQTRADAALRHRGGDRTYESRGPSRPLLSQRSRRRCRQRHPQRRRLQPSPRSRLAEDHFARHPTRATPTFTIRPALKPGFLTGNYVCLSVRMADGFAIDICLARDSKANLLVDYHVKIMVIFASLNANAGHGPL